MVFDRIARDAHRQHESKTGSISVLYLCVTKKKHRAQIIAIETCQTTCSMRQKSVGALHGRSQDHHHAVNGRICAVEPQKANRKEEDKTEQNGMSCVKRYLVQLRTPASQQLPMCSNAGSK